MSAALRKAYDAAQAADRKLDRVLRAEYPVGGPIRYRRYGRRCNGRVTRHAAIGDRLEVRNDLTGTTYWIYAYDVLQAAV